MNCARWRAHGAPGLLCPGRHRLCISAQRVGAACLSIKCHLAHTGPQSNTDYRGATVAPFTDIRWTSTDGLTLHARDYAGAGGAARLPVICLHGLTRNAADFDELAPSIAGLGRRVLALDVRGRGDSDWDPDPSHYNLNVYCDDVIALAHALGIGRAVFIGTSMGGLITMTLALRRLSLIGAAVLNDVGPALSARGLARITGFAGKGEVLRSWAEAAAYIGSVNQIAFPANTARDWDHWARRAFRETAPGRLELRYDPDIGVAVRAGAIRPASSVANRAFRRLAQLRPTLLIRGALSDLLEPEQLALMRDAAPGLMYAEVPDVGHAPMLTESAALAALHDFLGRVD
jgi:pimeloyl-ACP methyl ester carboxylesterase